MIGEAVEQSVTIMTSEMITHRAVIDSHSQTYCLAVDLVDLVAQLHIIMHLAHYNLLLGGDIYPTIISSWGEIFTPL